MGHPPSIHPNYLDALSFVVFTLDYEKAMIVIVATTISLYIQSPKSNKHPTVLSNVHTFTVHFLVFCLKYIFTVTSFSTQLYEFV